PEAVVPQVCRDRRGGGGPGRARGGAFRQALPQPDSAGGRLGRRSPAPTVARKQNTDLRIPVTDQRPEPKTVGYFRSAEISAQWCWCDLPLPDLRALGRRLQGEDGSQGQLPSDRLRRRYFPNQSQDR